MTATVVAIVADTHTNHRDALIKPGLVKADRSQRWLWGRWLDYCRTVESVAKQKRARIVSFFAGDVLEIDYKNRSKERLHTGDQAEALGLALETLAPLYEISDSVVVIRGTEAHTGGNGYMEELFAADLDNCVQSETTASWLYFRGFIEGVKFDVAHHASMGNLAHTEKNYANRLAHDIQRAYLEEWGERPPDVAVRGHNHRDADSGQNFDTLAVMLPGWQLPTNYIHRIAQAHRPARIGGVYFVCADGEFSWQKLIYKPRRKRARTL